jgi:hypothetical protein
MTFASKLLTEKSLNSRNEEKTFQPYVYRNLIRNYVFVIKFKDVSLKVFAQTNLFIIKFDFLSLHKTFFLLLMPRVGVKKKETRETIYFH